MDLKEALTEASRDETTDLYKALLWVKNSMAREERRFTLPAWEFKSVSLLHDQLVTLGYRAMVHTSCDTGVCRITVWW